MSMSTLFHAMSEHLYRLPTEEEVEMKKMYDHFHEKYSNQLRADIAFQDWYLKNKSLK